MTHSFPSGPQLTNLVILVQLLGGANEAKKGMFSIANDVSSWWANLDPGVPKPSQPSTSSARSATEAQQVIQASAHSKSAKILYPQVLHNLPALCQATQTGSCL